MEEVGRQLAAVVGQGSILFLGAEGGSQRVRQAIGAEQQRFVAVYRTILVEDAEIPETDTVFLTSPSNAEAYLNVRSLAGKTLIAIGHSTAHYLKERGLEPVLIPKTPTEEDVVGLLRTL
jgi:uroporphyrinogen-III synthase